MNESTAPVPAELLPEDFDLLTRLVRIPSVTEDVPNVNRAVGEMRRFLEERGVLCVTETLDGREILYASTKPGKVQDWLLNAHLDVVPAPKEFFEPRRDGDILRGRGVHDCKGNALAVARLLVDLAGTDASVGAIFSSDEETGGNTSAHMVSLGYGARRMVAVLDGGAYAIANAQKGIVSFFIRVHGRGGHSSAPWDFDNPIDRLVDGYARFRASWPEADPAAGTWRDSYAATILRAGETHNQIPDIAEMTVNVRTTTPDGAEKAERLLREAFGEAAEIEGRDACPPVFCDENTPEMRRLFAAMRERWPERNVSFFRMMGATDARHFASLGVPIAILGVGGGAAHSEKEWLALGSVAEYAAFLRDFFGRA